VAAYHAHIRFDCLRVAQPLEFPFSKNPQQFGLQLDGQLPNFIQEDPELFASSKRPISRMIQ
jgi:hypothetical protein